MELHEDVQPFFAMTEDLLGATARKHNARVPLKPSQSRPKAPRLRRLAARGHAQLSKHRDLARPSHHPLVPLARRRRPAVPTSYSVGTPKQQRYSSPNQNGPTYNVTSTKHRWRVVQPLANQLGVVRHHLDTGHRHRLNSHRGRDHPDGQHRHGLGLRHRSGKKHHYLVDRLNTPSVAVAAPQSRVPTPPPSPQPD